MTENEGSEKSPEKPHKKDSKRERVEKEWWRRDESH